MLPHDSSVRGNSVRRGAENCGSAFPSPPNQVDRRANRLRPLRCPCSAPAAFKSSKMPNKMLIDATHPEETRVVVVRGNRVEEFDFETAQRKQLRGNIYLAKVTRVEPSLQAAFIEYGGNRHGFLAFSEIHPDYYQIPVADRQALIEADERAHREAEENESRPNQHRRRSRHRTSRRRGHGERVQSDVVENATETALTSGEETATRETAPVELESWGGGTGADFRVHDEPAPEESATSAAEHGYADHHDTEQDTATDAPTHHEAQSVSSGFEPASLSPAEFMPATAETSQPSAGVEAIENGASEDSTLAPHHEPADEHVVTPEDNAEHDDEDDDEDDEDEDEDEDGEDDAEEEVESVGGDDVLEEVPERAFRPRRQYKIQEVIKRRQVMLVQVVKEERGNKGAALTTYLSLAGRYAVLMPNTARGGGISRKITSAQDRSRLKEVVQDLDVPEGMGIILRTAGASRTKPEIKRDFEYLIRMWETVRDMTLRSQAPTLVYEEGSLIKRSLRDLYHKEIDEIQVAGEAGHQQARDFMKMLMPANVRAVRQYRDGQPLFSRMGVESQLDAMFSPTVQLRSGGYIVINQTEALVSIDVNSGRSTREHHIEDTALKTNLEAAEEVARQLRLRDLAGLIVIDFIDMDEKRNNRAVERKLSDCLRQDRARIQVGRISHFGLLEMSRQRIRASVLESSTEPCPHCGGTGHVRSVSSVALQLLRGLEEVLMKGATHNLVVRTRTDVALYVLNHKRGHLRDLENSFKVTLSVIADPSVSGQQSYVIDRGEQVHTLETAKALLAAQVAAFPPAEDTSDEDEAFDIETESEIETDETEGLADEQPVGLEATESESEGGHRRRRRRRRRGRSGEPRDGTTRDDAESAYPAFQTSEGGEASSEDGEADDEELDEAVGTQPDNSQSGDRRPRRRGRRGGRRRRNLEEGLSGSIADELSPTPPPEAATAVADFDGYSYQPAISDDQGVSIASQPEQPAVSALPEPISTAPAEASLDADKAGKRRSTVREKVSFGSDVPSAPAPHFVQATEPEPSAPPADPTTNQAPEPAPRRAGWWSRRFGNRE